MSDLMTRLTKSLAGRLVLGLLALVLVLGVIAAFDREPEKNTLAAYFPSAVSIYEATDVRVLGVHVGEVTAVLPEGDKVRVEMEYDAEHKLPEGAQATIVTPTLVADRFVQITPAYTGGPELEDGAEIALQDTGVPVELDRIYGALRDLTAALGPNGVNKDGTLNRTLQAGSKALKGQGAQGNQMLRDMSQAATTFAEGSGDLFAAVSNLAEFTATLAENDELVRAFIADLADVSSMLAEEGDELQRALAAVARAVGPVEQFVKQNRQALVTDVEKLTRVVRAINSERENIDLALSAAPLALNNLNNGQDMRTRTQGSRIFLEDNVATLDMMMCAVIQQTDSPKALKDVTCELLKQLVMQAIPQTGDTPDADAPQRERAPRQNGAGGSPGLKVPTDELGSISGSIDNTLKGLLGGGG